MILVKFNDNYADEFDVGGFRFYEEKEWNKYKKLVKEKIKFPKEASFGTNEFIEYNSAEDYFKCTEVKKLSEEEYNFLVKLFGKYGIGIFIKFYLDE